MPRTSRFEYPSKHWVKNVFYFVTLIAAFGLLGMVTRNGVSTSMKNQYPYLVKRNRWTLARVSATTGVLVASASLIWASWAPILCAVPAAPTCWSAAIGATVVAAVSSIVTVAAQFTDNVEKRDLNYIENTTAHSIFQRYGDMYSLTNTTQHVYPVGNKTAVGNYYEPDETYDSIVQIFTDVGLGVPLLTTNPSSSFAGNMLKKRSSNNETLAVHWQTPLGFHTAVHLSHYDPVSMAYDIANQYKSGYNGTGIYGKNSSQLLSKRTNRYAVDWVSYNVDNENKDLEWDAWESTLDPGDWEEDIANALFTNFLENTWKWCITVMASGSTDYNSFGSADATHGEAYTNQYGGIDNYCNDNKGGAQCSTDGCQ